MAGRTSRKTWWLAACAASALMLAAVVLLLGRARATSKPAIASQPIATATPRCDVPEPKLLRALPDAEGPPVILWAVGDVRIFVDGKGAFSPPEDPKHFTATEHTLRLEADGAAPLETKVRLDPYSPALFHAALTPGVGLTLLRIGAHCASCEAPLGDVVLASAKATARTKELLTQAADALRTDQWLRARSLLEQVPAKDRTSSAYQRLLSSFWSQAGDLPRAAQAALASAKGDAELRGLLARVDQLQSAERDRYAQVMLARWNKLTEQQAALLRVATGVVDLDVNSSSHRMEELSAAFNQASEKKDPIEQEKVFLAAEQTVSGLLTRMMSARADDCAFRTRVVQAAAAGGAL